MNLRSILLSLGLTATCGLHAAVAADNQSAGLVTAARQAQTAWVAPPQAPRPEPGKTVYVVTCTAQAIGCARAAQGVSEAGKRLGWTVRVIDGKGDPGTWNAAIQSALAAGADGIVIDAVPPLLVGDALARAAQARIPVVSIFNPLPGADSPVFAYVRPDHRAQGRLMANWAITDSAGQAQVLLIEDRQFPELRERVEGFREQLARCASCKVVGTVESTIGTMAQRLAGAVATELMRSPQVGYVIAPFDSNAFFAGEGLRQAGRLGRIKLGGYEGDPQALEAIRSGTQTVSIANPAEWMGWQAVDELNRAFHGQPASNLPVRFRLIDRSNVPDTKGWLGDLDFRTRYVSLWQLR